VRSALFWFFAGFKRFSPGCFRGPRAVPDIIHDLYSSLKSCPKRLLFYGTGGSMGTLRPMPTTTHSPARKSPHPPAIQGSTAGPCVGRRQWSDSKSWPFCSRCCRLAGLNCRRRKLAGQLARCSRRLKEDGRRPAIAARYVTHHNIVWRGDIRSPAGMTCWCVHARGIGSSLLSKLLCVARQRI
jgi:hypothetical protein